MRYLLNMFHIVIVIMFFVLMCSTTVFLSVLITGALVAVLVLRPWEDAATYQRFPRAAIASNGHVCAEIGRSILQKNGTAVDAAIAVLLCEDITCPQCLGLTGGFIATIYDARQGRVRVLNSRERAPAGSSVNMYETASSAVGGLAMGIPGELRGYGAMYREYGRLPWRELIEPTANLCRNGHIVSSYLARALKDESHVIKNDPSLREVYVNEATGEVWKEGDRIVEQTLARTLDIIAEEGPEAMHNGTLTAPLVRDIRAHGGIITEDDLRNYKVKWEEPIVARLDDQHTLYTSPLPASGAVLAFILNMLHGYVGTEQAPVGSPLYWHRVVETFKYAYAKRTGLGDTSRTNLNYDIRELERNLSDPAWARGFRALVNDAHTNNDWRHYGAEFEGADDHGTAHSVVIAPDGSAVSITSTINYVFGCKRRSRALGLVLNNQMDDFSVPNVSSGYGLPPSPANMIAAGLQPLSSMVPSIVLNAKKEVVFACGAAGGTKITTQIALLIRYTVVEGLDLPTAMSHPRLHHQLLPMKVQYENTFNMAIIDSLKKKGHALHVLDPTEGFAAAVACRKERDGRYVPMYDIRRGGSVSGL